MPPGSEAVVMPSALEVRTTSVKDRVAVCLGLEASETVKATVKVPAAVGVPESLPDVGSRVIPAGSEPLLIAQT